MAAITLRDIKFRWQAGQALTLDIDRLEVAQGERLFLYGPSGSGKSTLLNLLAGIVEPEQGEVLCVGHELGGLSNRALDRYRADHVGMIFQQFNLVPYLSVLDNVLLPCHFSTRRRKKAEVSGSIRDEARRRLRQLGLGSEAWVQQVTRLSVGQQQRVAAARALIGQPELIIADEPTSALDSERRAAFLELLVAECEVLGSTLLFVSHDLSLTGYFTRTESMTQLNRAGQEHAP
ncbi:MAG: ABC transporter ATP-binding protein [Burkholderiales bacterium]